MLENKIMYEEIDGFITITIDSELGVENNSEEIIQERLFKLFKEFKTALARNTTAVAISNPHVIVYKFMGAEEVMNRMYMRIKLLNATQNYEFISFLRKYTYHIGLKLGRFTKFAFIDNIPSSESKYAHFCSCCGTKMVMYVQYKFEVIP
jgi:hypothetical protein